LKIAPGGTLASADKWALKATRAADPASVMIATLGQTRQALAGIHS
jgi:hypothetical protein